MKKTTIMLALLSSVMTAGVANADSFTMQPAPMSDQMPINITQGQINSGNFYGQQQPAQDSKGNDYGFSVGNRVAAEKEKAAEAPKTAAEQGYQSMEEMQRANNAAKDYFYKNTARQKGIVITVPTEDVGVAKDKKMNMWLLNWKGRLTDRGISAEKVDFEASRLNKEDFERWASRQIRYSDE